MNALKMYRFVSVTFALVTIACAQLTADPTVTVKQGQLRGTNDTDLNGNNFLKFSGIPYATPPVNNLRFKAPQPPTNWTGVRDATKEGNACSSIDLFQSRPTGSEDCLYLNVFTRKLPRQNQPMKPVMVFFHGGGFVRGSGSETMQGPKYLLTQDVVLVTINFRLGIFGFLSSDDVSLDVPGNAGLKDQTLALKWVKENIASFNGDPDNVTIFGISSGAASVHFQILSPTAKGLFQKAIAQSGCVFNPWAWGRKNAIEVVGKLGSNVSTDKEALDILWKTDSVALLNATAQIRDVIVDSSKLRPLGPVIELPNPTAFLTENPYLLLASGRFNQVPTIMGTTNNEGMLYGITRFDTTNPPPDPRDSEILWSLGLDARVEKREEIKKILNDFYFKNGLTANGTYQIVGDAMFLIGEVESVKLAVMSSSSPIYFYVFSYETPLVNVIKTILGINATVHGVPHSGDQQYLFNSALLAANLTSTDRQAIDTVVKIWTDFAKTGKPLRNWLPVQKEKFQYLNIKRNPTMHKGIPFPRRVALWERIFMEAAEPNTKIRNINFDQRI